MLVFKNYLHLYSYSSLVIRIATRVGSSPLSATTCSNIDCAYNTRTAGSVARMSTVAIPQQPLSQPIHHQPPSPSYDPHDSAFDSETPTSSRASSRSGRQSRRSQDRTKSPPSGQASRMSAFFPLGYKEAASQWVCSLHDALAPDCDSNTNITLQIVEQPLPTRL